MMEILQGKTPQLAIAFAIAISTTAIAFRVIRSSDVEITLLNSKLELSNQINQASDLILQLDQIEGQLKEKQLQYELLEDKYNQLVLASSPDSSLKELSGVVAQVSAEVDTSKVSRDIELAKAELGGLSESVANNN